MTELKTLVQEVLSDGFVMNLGISDKNGPWVASVVYVFDEDFNIYWISVPDTRHSRAIIGRTKVAGTIMADHRTDQERALQFDGFAEKLEGHFFKFEQALQRKRGLPIPERAGEILKGVHDWYRLTPSHIELIYNKLFGYERKQYVRANR